MITVRTPHGGTLRVDVRDRDCPARACFRLDTTYDKTKPEGRRLSYRCHGLGACPTTTTTRSPAAWERRDDGWHYLPMEELLG